jgi:pimeloyl-ACP methyl ester carboxylesterase
VIVGGLNDPGWGPSIERQHLHGCFQDPRILCVVIAFEPDLDDCREKLIRTVNEKFPGQQVDVIGLSLGGLVARYAATPIADKPHLSVVRLFTISSPHTGAKLARMPTLDRKVAEMRPGSNFLTHLAEQDSTRTYQLVPYVRLGDEWVGDHHAAPAGVTPWWVDTPPLEHAHIGASVDPRILADIALRLRDEPPLTHDPPAPLPGG